MKHRKPKTPGKYIYTPAQIQAQKSVIRRVAQGILDGLENSNARVSRGVRDLPEDLHMLSTMERVNRHAERGDSRSKILAHAKNMCVRSAIESPTQALAWSAVVQWMGLNPDLPVAK